MVEVEMSKDIRDYEPKLLGPFTKRQLICVLIGIGYAVPLYFVFNTFISEFVVKLIICVILAVPAFACGWCDLYGMHLEQFGLHLLKTLFLTKRCRIVASENVYEAIDGDIPDASADTKKKKKKKVRYSKTEKPIK